MDLDEQAKAAQSGTLVALDSVATYMEEEAKRNTLRANRFAIEGKPGEMFGALDDAHKCLKHRMTLMLLRHAVVKHGYSNVMRFLEGAK